MKISLKNNSDTIDQKLYLSIINGNPLLLQFLLNSNDLDVTLLTPIKVNKLMAVQDFNSYQSVISSTITETIFSVVLESQNKNIVDSVLEKLNVDFENKDIFNSTIEKYVLAYVNKIFKEHNSEIMLEFHSFLSEKLKFFRKSDDLLIDFLDEAMKKSSFSVENKKTWEYLVALYDKGFLKNHWFNEKIDCSSLWIQEYTKKLSRIEYYLIGNIENQNYEFEIIDCCKILSSEKTMPTLSIPWEEYYITCWKNSFDFFEEPLNTKINNKKCLIQIPHKISFLEANNLNNGIINLSKNYDLTEHFNDWVVHFNDFNKLTKTQKYDLIKNKIENYLLKKDVSQNETKKNKHRF